MRKKGVAVAVALAVGMCAWVLVAAQNTLAADVKAIVESTDDPFTLLPEGKGSGQSSSSAQSPDSSWHFYISRWRSGCYVYARAQTTSHIYSDYLRIYEYICRNGSCSSWYRTPAYYNKYGTIRLTLYWKNCYRGYYFARSRHYVREGSINRYYQLTLYNKYL